MKQSGQRIQNPNLGAFLDSATNAIDKGQQQFYTPPNLAAALFKPLEGLGHNWILDPHCGSGHLLGASGMPFRYGIDIDHRSAKSMADHDSEDVTYRIQQADFTHWFPLAAEIDFKADLICMNPPFSLRWHADRLAALGRSDLPGIADTYRAHAKNGTIDSTLASLLCGIELLSGCGEGFLICNADTAARFLGHPGEEAKSELRRYLWLWLEIPGVVYENVTSKFATAVLYFSSSHGMRNSGDPPMFLQSPGSEAATIGRTLVTALTSRRFAHLGREMESAYLSQHGKGGADKWFAIAEEYRFRHTEATRPFNLSLDSRTGRIRVHLDTFSRLKLDMSVVQVLHELKGKRPEALVVQQVSRVALQEALTSGVWTVDPALIQAVERAVENYNAVRAPFFRPNPVQALGWIDEVERITATRSGLPGIVPGQRYKLRTYTEDIAYPGHKTNLAGEKEALTFHSQELVIEVTGEDGFIHSFHVRRTEDQPERSGQEDKTRHHLIPVLIDHFEIPIPADITTLHPERYTENKQILARLEQRIRRNLSAA